MTGKKGVVIHLRRTATRTTKKKDCPKRGGLREPLVLSAIRRYTAPEQVNSYKSILKQVEK